MKLTHAQKQDLRTLAKPGRNGISRRSCTNSTLCALARRGLVELTWVPSEHTANHTVECWIITDAGRALVKETGR